HYLSVAHTMSRYKNAFHSPLLSDWRAYEYWLKDGGKDYAQRASNKWKQLLEEYQKPDIDPAVEQALGEFAERRKREIGTAEI
ncbi:MAG: trimethylamine methyltransferase family protein, partial [Gemmatimonadota bacterium]|nr:trimethylamine methyltransferase family protein [Gemmatimonadota bacterium]